MHPPAVLSGGLLDDAEAVALTQFGQARDPRDAVERGRDRGLLPERVGLAELGAGVAVDELGRLEPLVPQRLLHDQYVALVQPVPTRTELVTAGGLLTPLPHGSTCRNGLG